MDLLKLFALLVAVATVHITADAPKKKIRIHLPQKVKHIHHHKKIYITNHPASSQYAPAFMPSAEGAVAVPTNVAMPSVASVLPLNSVELYDESPTRMPGISSAASKLLPLYRARGYYGPTPHEWDDQEYDMAPPLEPTDGSYIPTAFSAPAAPTAPSNYPPKRVKIVKVNDPPRKKSPRKYKPKRVIVRGKPGQAEEEHPVSTFHEHFYSDLDGSGTIRKIKKPQRVEKIIDGDTEHIHTYSEEHIHKLVFDEGSKLNGMVGIDPAGSMSALAASHPLIPLNGFTAVGSMGTPSHLEYASYNPREVTHDHIFHDHGEIPPNVDITKDHLAYPPRMTYNSQGLRIGIGANKGLKSKYSHKYLKPQIKPTQMTDFTYYENIYAPYNKLHSKPTIPTPFEPASDQNLEDYRPVPHFKVKDKGNAKTRNVVPALYFGNGKQVSDYRLQQASVQSPYSVSSTVVHDYKPKQYPGHTSETVGFTKYNKNLYTYPSNYEYDSYTSSSNFYAADNPTQSFQGKKGKKKSISTQNISFGGLDHQTTVDHLEDSGVSATSLNGAASTAIENYSSYDQPKALESAPSTAFTIRENSPVHPYYAAMAAKALHGDQVSLAEASNDNYQYAEAPTPSTTPHVATVASTNAPEQEYYDMQRGEPITTETTNYETRPRSSPKDINPDVLSPHIEHKPRYKILALQPKESSHESDHYYRHSADTSSAPGKLKYGDKI